MGDEKYIVYNTGSGSISKTVLQQMTAEGFRSLPGRPQSEVLQATPEEFDTNSPILVRNAVNDYFIMLLITGFHRKSFCSIR